MGRSDELAGCAENWDGELVGWAMPPGVTLSEWVWVFFLTEMRRTPGVTSVAWIIGPQPKIVFVSGILKVKKVEWRILQRFLIRRLLAEAWPHYQVCVCYSWAHQTMTCCCQICWHSDLTTICLGWGEESIDSRMHSDSVLISIILFHKGIK